MIKLHFWVDSSERWGNAGIPVRCELSHHVWEGRRLNRHDCVRGATSPWEQRQEACSIKSLRTLASAQRRHPRTATGSLSFKPALTLSGSSGTVKEGTSFKANASAGTASKGLTQKGATLSTMAYTASVTFPAGTSCLSLEGAGSAASSAKVKYTSSTSTPINVSTIKWSGYDETTNSGGYIEITLPNSGGTSVTTGSFAGNSSGLCRQSDQTESNLIASCESTKGLSKITFTGKGGASTLTVG